MFQCLTHLWSHPRKRDHTGNLWPNMRSIAPINLTVEMFIQATDHSNHTLTQDRRLNYPNTLNIARLQAQECLWTDSTHHTLGFKSNLKLHSAARFHLTQACLESQITFCIAHQRTLLSPHLYPRRINWSTLWMDMQTGCHLNRIRSSRLRRWVEYLTEQKSQPDLHPQWVERGGRPEDQHVW